MRTSIDLSINAAINGSVDQNTEQNSSKITTKDNAMTNALNAYNEPRITTDINLNNNNNAFNPSIGKWMYERDDYLEEAIDLTNKWNKANQWSVKHNSDSDDIEIIDSFNAGPSGLNVVQNNDNNSKSINNLISDCDLNPSLDSSETELKFDEIVFDLDVDRVNETITIDDVSSENGDNGCANASASASASNEDDPSDVEIIKVKFFSEPIELDSEIEVLSEILTPREVIDLMRNNLKSVQQLTRLSLTTIRVILSKYDWNKDQFVSDFFEHGIEPILKHWKIVISYEVKFNAKRRKTKHSDSTDAPLAATDSQEEMKTCLVCFDESNIADMFGSNCGHCLCIDCWNQYIATHVNDASSDDKICCPGDNCPNILEDEDLIRVIREGVTRDKYQRLVTNSFVTKNALLRWCPNGDCLHAVRVRENSFQDIECICKTVFCFLCGDQWHEPLSCDMYKNWIQKYASQTIDPKSANWLVKHTKCCPKCRFPIEKNGGCNYVICTKCRYSFCYYCLGKCSHGRCLGQNASDAQKAQLVDETLKQDMRLYPFYKDSYQNQLKQLRLEKTLQEGVNQKLEKAVKSPEFKSALKFLKSAFTVLCHCRQTLMYSYVFGYYLMGPKPQIDVYVNNLSELEQQTSNLSKILTNETTVIQKESVIQMKRKVQQSYRECESKRSTLVQHIKLGLTSGCAEQWIWVFIPI